jgi:hypothetical protein
VLRYVYWNEAHDEKGARCMAAKFSDYAEIGCCECAAPGL